MCAPDLLWAGPGKGARGARVDTGQARSSRLGVPCYSHTLWAFIVTPAPGDPEPGSTVSGLLRFTTPQFRRRAGLRRLAAANARLTAARRAVRVGRTDEAAAAEVIAGLSLGRQLAFCTWADPRVRAAWNGSGPPSGQSAAGSPRPCQPTSWFSRSSESKQDSWSFLTSPLPKGPPCTPYLPPSRNPAS